MAATLEVESTLTDRYQTTVPETVRRALKLGKRDKIHYTIRPSGEVVLTRVEASDGDDPVLGSVSRLPGRRYHSSSRAAASGRCVPCV